MTAADQIRYLAFTGKMGSGKSTAATFFEAYGFKRLSFADEIKRVATLLWPNPRRKHVQELGPAIAAIDPAVWVAAMRREISDVRREQPTAKIVIDDLRFPIEYEFLASSGFTIAGVEAPEVVRLERLISTKRIEDNSQLEHPTETALDDTEMFPRHLTFTNDGSPRQFTEQLDKMLDGLYFV